MSPSRNNYVRFTAQPPEKKPPPRDCTDVYFDPETGELVREDYTGAKIPLMDQLDAQPRLAYSTDTLPDPIAEADLNKIWYTSGSVDLTTADVGTNGDLLGFVAVGGDQDITTSTGVVQLLEGETVVFRSDGSYWYLETVSSGGQGAVRFDINQTLTAPQQEQARENIGLHFSVSWGSGDFLQTPHTALLGPFYADNPYGEHMLINSAVSGEVSTADTHGNVLAIQGKNGMASAIRFIDKDGFEVGAVGYLSDAGGSWYAEDYVYISASEPYGPGSSTVPGSPPKGLMLAQEGDFLGDRLQVGRLVFHPSWRWGFYGPRPIDPPQMTMTPFGRICFGAEADDSEGHFVIKKEDPESLRVDLKNTHANGEAQFKAQTQSGNTAKLTAVPASFSYPGHIYRASSGTLLSDGAGGMLIAATHADGYIRFAAGGDESDKEHVYIAPYGGVTFKKWLRVDENGNAVIGTYTTAVTWDPGSLADGASETKSAITLNGVAVGDPVVAALTTIVSPDWDVQACVTAANTIAVRITNRTGGTVDLGSGTLRISCIKMS